MKHTAHDSRIISACVGQPPLLSPPVSPNFLSLAASAPALPDSKIGAPPWHIPILESLPVYWLWSFLLIALFTSCSPLRTSAHDEHHQWELTIHEVQTNLDDLRHDINCFQTEIQILEGRIKYFENALTTLKQQDLETHQAKIEQLSQLIHQLEKKWTGLEKTQIGGKEEIEELSTHAKQTTTSLIQFKARIEELEKEILSQNRRLDGIAKGKGKGPLLYKVKPGDSLDKIAKAHGVNVEQLKKANQLDQDLIKPDQELKIPQ